MIQTETTPVDTKPESNNNQPTTRVRRRIKKHPFKVSALRMSESATLILRGTFSGHSSQFEIINFIFGGPIIKGASELRLKVAETFCANGSKRDLAKTIATHAKKGKMRIAFDNYSQWEDVIKVFPKNKV